MSRSLAKLAARRQVLIAEIELQRMQFELHIGDARAALRPAGLLGGALARPTALLALVNAVAPLFGRRVARIARLAAVALAALRILRVWRSRAPEAPREAPAE